MLSELATADVVVLFIGSNDLDDIYGSVFNNTESPTALSSIVSRLTTIHDYIRTNKPAVPIVVCTVADVGATPSRAASYPDPAKRITTRAKVAALNQSVISMAQGRGASVARIDRLTDRAYDEIPFHLNGTVFALAGASDNPPGRVFSQDNFHPATVGQFMIANEILTACSAATSRPLTIFPNREILTLLGFNPDAPYNSWKSGFPALGSTVADDDRDGAANLVEYALGTSPQQHSSIFQFPAADGTLRFPTSPAALRYVSLRVMESGELQSWSAVPNGRISIGADGTWTVAPSSTGRAFYRLAAAVRP